MRWGSKWMVGKVERVKDEKGDKRRMMEREWER